MPQCNSAAVRSDLEHASESFRLFREQPTPELARDARERVRLAISPRYGPYSRNV